MSRPYDAMRQRRVNLLGVSLHEERTSTCVPKCDVKQWQGCHTASRA